MATPDNKRKAEDAPDADGAEASAQDAKKARLGGGHGAAPGLDLSVLEKAKKALQMQQGLKEKLARLKQAGAAAPGAAPPAARPGTKLPPPLVLDEQGREVGAGPAPPPRAPKAPLQLISAEEAAAEDERFYDPDLGWGNAPRRVQRRPRPELQFVEEGTFQKQAETARLRAQYGDDYVKDLAQRRRQEKAAAADGRDANLVPLGERGGGGGAAAEAEEAEAAAAAAAVVPDVEWWDARILADKAAGYGGAAAGGAAALRADRITHYVEHPLPLDPPAEAPAPPPQPLRLTKRELKKLRTQRRVAREQDKQELIRQGLLEPPKPKVKISNLMRVLGADATADPTAVEAEVRRQMAERAAAHADHNLARQLTPAELKAKKLRKLLGAGAEGAVDTRVAVYKVGDLSHPQLRFKVQVNAQELQLGGALVAAAGAFAAVVVEGPPKAQARYEKLMLRRIAWDAQLEEPRGGGDAADGGGGGGERAPNFCRLAWQGVVKEGAFKGKFKTMDMPSGAAARRVLAERGVGHYWDLAEAVGQDE
jgi:U4/U6 small nuclear ribonucleoprotein PRP3